MRRRGEETVLMISLEGNWLKVYIQREGEREKAGESIQLVVDLESGILE